MIFVTSIAPFMSSGPLRVAGSLSRPTPRFFFSYTLKLVRLLKLSADPRLIHTRWLELSTQRTMPSAFSKVVRVALSISFPQDDVDLHQAIDSHLSFWRVLPGAL